MGPVYAEYCLWETRLSTFDDVTYRDTSSKCAHSCEELAVAGFFYAGYGDCVQCFYCGLGLKAWREYDNVYVEHQRHRGQCPFLNNFIQSKNQLELGLLSKDPAVEGASTSEEVSLLRSENRYLKKRLFCRMCFRNPANALFLPCGEIVVCQQCSDIISTCPSCQEKVEATASVYLV